MFGSYLRAKRKEIAMTVILIAVAAVMFYLYGLPQEAVWYTAVICAFPGCIVTALDYGKYRRKYRTLLQLETEISVTLDRFPQPGELIEEEYQRISRLLFEDRQRIAQEQDARRRAQMEYYTIWVHQIKTPIAAMRLLLQQSAQEPETALQGSVLFELGDELQRIEQYVEMVLGYLRLEGDSTDYVIREYDLDRILRQAVRRHAPAFIRKRLSLHYEPFHVRVVTDEKWLFFVLDQVLSNALKYTNRGSVSITLEAPKTICIRDTGIGIAPEDLPRIFEKGYTGENGRADKRASGIGMYLCRRICENLGHRIVVTSKPGEGTEVRIDVKNAELEVE